MKLFVWSNIEVLAQHARGSIYVLANERTEALREAVNEYRRQTEGRNLVSWESVESLEKELNEKEPTVVNELAAFIEYGSA